MDKEELEAQISYYATKYYEGNPEITDAQFDMLVDKLRSIDPNSNILKTGWGFEVIGDKVKHKYSHIGSLDKTKCFADIPERFKNVTVYVSPKLDGLSAVVYYENGKLVRAITRGNGEYGKDITNKIAKIIGTEIFDKKFTGAVRGELIINDKNCELLQNKYSDLISSRNFAAGIINRKELDEDVSYIDLVVYKVVGHETNIPFKERSDMLLWLQTNFKHCIPIEFFPVLNESCWEEQHEKQFEQFKKLGYALDGLVLSSSNLLYDSMNQCYLYNEIAFKFQAETATTIVKEIKWELSRTQRLVPIAIIEPVELSGAIVRRATCNNAKWILNMNIERGCIVEIVRSGEIIPQILRRVDI